MAPVPGGWRRLRVAGIVLSVVLVALTVSAAAYGWWLGADRLPELLVSELTLAPNLVASRSITFDAVVFDHSDETDDDAAVTRPAPIINLPPGGCEALTMIPSAIARKLTKPGTPAKPPRVKVDLIPSTMLAGQANAQRASCWAQLRRLSVGPMPAPSVAATKLTSEQSEPLWVDIPSGELPTSPLLTQKGLRRLQLVGRPFLAASSGHEMGLAPFGGEASSPLVPTGKGPTIVLEGRELALDATLTIQEGRPFLAVQVNAQRLTRLDINGVSWLKCWRWRKAVTTAAIFLVPSWVDRALRAAGASCVGLWAP